MLKVLLLSLIVVDPALVRSVYQTGQLNDENINFVSRGIRSAEFRTKSLKFWMQKLFIKVYSTTPSKISKSGKQTYDRLRLAGFEPNKVSGVLAEQPNAQLKQLVDVWVQRQLISTAQGEELKSIMDGTIGRKKIKKLVYKTNDDGIVYSVIGYISLRTSQNEQPSTGAVAYAFGKFKFAKSVDVTSSESSNCKVWGMLCRTTVTFRATGHTITGKQQTGLHRYLKQTVLNAFRDSSGPTLNYLQTECERYRKFLPESFKADLAQIESNPNKRPDQVVNRDVFNPANYL